MWFEIIPAALIIMTAMYLPSPLICAANYLALGNKHRRWLGARFDRQCYQRDWARFGNPYGASGWESINPDEEDEEECDCTEDPECSPECEEIDPEIQAETQGGGVQGEPPNQDNNKE